MNILTQAQAQAVYAAMLALNEIGAIVCTTIGPLSKRVTVEEFAASGYVFVNGIGANERYVSQSEFATAYGLNA